MDKNILMAGLLMMSAYVISGRLDDLHDIGNLQIIKEIRQTTTDAYGKWRGRLCAGNDLSCQQCQKDFSKAFDDQMQREATVRLFFARQAQFDLSRAGDFANCSAEKDKQEYIRQAEHSERSRDEASTYIDLYKGTSLELEFQKRFEERNHDAQGLRRYANEYDKHSIYINAQYKQLSDKYEQKARRLGHYSKFCSNDGAYGIEAIQQSPEITRLLDENQDFFRFHVGLISVDDLFDVRNRK